MEVFPLAALHGVLMFGLTRLLRGDEALIPVALVLLPFLTLGPVILGHLLRYDEAPSYAYTQVHNDIQGNYPQIMKEMDAEPLFAEFVEFHTGKRGDGFFDYLRLYATQGFEGWEGRMHADRHGPWVWNAWFLHCLMYLFGSGAGLAGFRMNED